MKRIKVLFLAALLTVGLMGIAPRVEAANWVWVASTKFATIKIDASKCRWMNGKLYCWESWYYIDSKERNEEIATYQKLANIFKRNVDYSNFREMISHLVMYQGKDGTIYLNVLQEIAFDNDGHMIESVDMSSFSSYNAFAPGTIADKEYHVAKRYAR